MKDGRPNYRSPLDARTALCFHVERHRPGASESGRWQLSYAPVRFTLSLFAVVLLVTACKRHEDSADDKIRKILPGIWVFEARYASGGATQCTLTVAPDGSYVSTVAIPGRTNGPRTINMEGTFRVENGLLIDTITKDSQTNARVPYTNQARIIRIDDHELVLDNEKILGLVYPTNQTVFRKQTK